jgi:arylsulfatase A-like enzyme
MRVWVYGLLLGLGCSSAAPSTIPAPKAPMIGGAPVATPPQPSQTIFSFLDNRLLAHPDAQGPYLWLGDPGALRSVRSLQVSLNELVAGERAAIPLARNLAFSLYVPPSNALPTELRVKVYNEAPTGSLKASLAGVLLSELPLVSGWQVVRFPLTSMVAGENLFQLSLNATKGAISWVHAAEAGATELTPPKDLLEKKDDKRVLRIAPNGSLSFFLMPPSNASLLASLRSADADCTVSLRTQRDNEPEQELTTVSVNSAAWQESLILLGGTSTVATRLTISAKQCKSEVYWGEPRITAPGEASPTGVKSPVKRVIIWVIDTQRADSYDFYNPTTRVVTPNYSKLVKEATLFEDCYSTGNESQASGASLHSSVYPAVHKVFQEKNKLPLSLTTIAEAFSAAGFKTAGYSANGYISKGWQFTQGFDEFVSVLHEKKPDDAGYLWSLGKSFLEKHPDEKLLIYLHTAEPHVPYSANKGIIQRYETNYKGRYPYAVTGNETGAIRGGKLILTEAERVHIRALYDNEVEQSDKYFGEMIQYLQEKDLMKDSLLLITADHGEDMFEHGERRIGHGRSLFQPTIWIPFIIYAPSLYPAGKRVSVGVEHIDMLPSMLEAAGIGIPDTAQGEPLLQMARAETLYPRSTISTWFLNQYALKLGRYKWVTRNISDGDLFDLQAYPEEKTTSTKSAPIAARLMQETMAFYLPFQTRWKKATWGVSSNVSASFIDEISKTPIKL